MLVLLLSEKFLNTDFTLRYESFFSDCAINFTKNKVSAIIFRVEKGNKWETWLRTFSFTNRFKFKLMFMIEF
jgi:hypothetical protein